MTPPPCYILHSYLCALDPVSQTIRLLNLYSTALLVGSVPVHSTLSWLCICSLLTVSKYREFSLSLSPHSEEFNHQQPLNKYSNSLPAVSNINNEHTVQVLISHHGGKA